MTLFCSLSQSANSVQTDFAQCMLQISVNRKATDWYKLIFYIRWDWQQKYNRICWHNLRTDWRQKLSRVCWHNLQTDWRQKLSRVCWHNLTADWSQKSSRVCWQSNSRNRTESVQRSLRADTETAETEEILSLHLFIHRFQLFK